MHPLEGHDYEFGVIILCLSYDDDDDSWRNFSIPAVDTESCNDDYYSCHCHGLVVAERVLSGCMLPNEP
jgi:hypothetical protein